MLDWSFGETTSSSVSRSLAPIQDEERTLGVLRVAKARPQSRWGTGAKTNTAKRFSSLCITA
jgi:hypothetical protein